MAWQTDTATAAAIAAAIFGSADKITELSALSTSLGSGPLTLTIKRAASGFNWNTATTVLQGTLTGPHVISAGKLRPGQVTGITTAIGANLATGEAWVRIANGAGTRWAQAPLNEVTANGGFIVPRSPTSDANTVRAMVLAEGFGFAGSSDLAAAPDTELFRVTLANETASEQAAGFVTPMFGCKFQQGQIPAGTYPHFQTAAGTACAPTLWGVTSWPDGSMKFCGAMVRVPAAVPAAPTPGTGLSAVPGTLDIQVRSGGNAPAPSSRALSNLTAADIVVQLDGVTNLSGTWLAALNTAITDNDEIVLWGDGPAGKVYRIRGDFKQSGARHGQLITYHYVAILQNSVGGLMGTRYLGWAMQPWGDVGQGTNTVAGATPAYAGPAPQTRIAVASLKAGGSTVRALQGHNDSQTAIGDNIAIGHYTGFFTAGHDGRWDYFQSGGSAATDCVVRVLHNKEQDVKSRLFPPYHTTYIPDRNPELSYRPYGNGLLQGGEPGMYRIMSSGGERGDIAVLPNSATKHFMTRSAVDERNMRVYGLVASGWRVYIKLRSTGNVIAANDFEPSYAGLGTAQPGWRYWPGATDPNETKGIQHPLDKTSLWASEYEPSHRPSAAYYPYMMTGEPQYLDMLTDHGTGMLLSLEAGHKEMNLNNPLRTSITIGSAWGRRTVIMNGVSYKGGGYFFNAGQIRLMAWGSRDITQAAALYPDVCPYGTEVRKYLRQSVEAMYFAINKYNELRGPAWDAAGIYDFGTGVQDADMWCSGYMSNSVCHQSSIYPNAQITHFRQRLGRHWKQINAKLDIAVAASYMATFWKEDESWETDSGDILHALFYDNAYSSGTTLTFDAATDRFTVTDTNGAWKPTNGDIFAFQYPPSGLETYFQNTTFPFAYPVNRRKMYAINVSGATAQLSYTPDGPPIDVTSSMNVRGFFAHIKDFRPRFTAEGTNNSGQSYIANLRSAIRHHNAVGDDVADALVQVDERCTRGGVTYAELNKNHLTTTYPGV